MRNNNSAYGGDHKFDMKCQNSMFGIAGKVHEYLFRYRAKKLVIKKIFSP